ncbi:MAG: phosphate propanoyltransferase [Deltaproteobacteria bacterium]|nr:phosphate propanoyltransferase [Deltaproteobacteria bacterium]
MTRSGDNAVLPVAVSGRHVHLSREDCELLFGPDHELIRSRDVTQPGQYACVEAVSVVGPAATLEQVAVVGPLRAQTQVELSRTDAIRIGVDPPVRESGHLANTPGVILRGPRGSVELRQGAIVALRHLHATPEDARRLGLRDGAHISVRVRGPRALVFEDVVVRVSPSFKLDVHLDTDEANAAGVERGGTCEIVA